MSLESFTPQVRDWFLRSFEGPTEAQKQAWPAIARGENVLLSGLNTDALRGFLAAPSSYRRTSILPDVSPSDVIVADLERRAIAAGS